MNRVFLTLIISSLIFSALDAQDLYTARSYWQEFNQLTYKKIRDKKQKDEILTDSEKLYLSDYENYLFTYYQRMSEDEQRKFEEMKSKWDAELGSPIITPRQDKTSELQEFTWRPKDRVHNGLYGFYYGATLAAVTKAGSGLAGGLPLMAAGLWQLGPVINPKKYEGIGPSTMRAAGTGKILGLGYGLGLGLAIGGNTSSTGDLMLGLSTLGSIGLGEAAFQIQKRKNYSDGRIELIRHYGFLGPAVGLASVLATSNSNSNLAGTSIVVGGIGGLILGNQAAKKYNYTVGDVDAISSLTWIYAGGGFAFVGESVQDGNRSQGLLLLPAVTAISGTLLGQRMVRGANLTTRQGSMINLASGGAALIGLGAVTTAKAQSLGVIIGVPSALALVAHQLVFHSFKTKNLQQKIQLGSNTKYPVHFSLHVAPENYFANLNLKPGSQFPVGNAPVLSNPIIKLKFTF